MPSVYSFKEFQDYTECCVCFVGVNLLIGTDSGLMLLDRSGQGKGEPIKTADKMWKI